MPVKDESYWQKLAAKYPLLGNVLTMFLGTGLSQVIPFLAAPIIGRLFTPDERAIYTYFVAIAAGIATFATLRYEQAIVLANTDSEARLLVRLTVRFALGTSAIVTVLAFFIAPLLAELMRAPDLKQLLPLVGISVLCSSLVMVWTYWLNRKRSYRRIASNKVEVAVVGAVGQIGAPYAGLPGALGLTLGAILAQIVAILRLGWKARDSRITPETALAKGTASTRELTRRYRQLPLLNLPTAVLDAVRINAIPLLIGAIFGHWVAGNFSYAWMLAQAPVVLISGAFSQVYYQHLATTPRGELHLRVVQILKRSFLLAAVPFLILAVISPWFFPLYLGQQWQMAGWMATLLTPWLYLNSVASPVSTVFVITNRQQVSLIFATFFMAAPLLALWAASASGLTPLTGIGITSGVMAIMLLVYLALVLHVTGAYDRERS